MKTATNEKTDTTPMLTKAEAAAYLSISQPTLMRLVASGQIKASRVGLQWRFNPSEIQAFLERSSNQKAVSQWGD